MKTLVATILLASSVSSASVVKTATGLQITGELAKQVFYLLGVYAPQVKAVLECSEKQRKVECVKAVGEKDSTGVGIIPVSNPSEIRLIQLLMSNLGSTNQMTVECTAEFESGHSAFKWQDFVTNATCDVRGSL